MPRRGLEGRYPVERNTDLDDRPSANGHRRRATCLSCVRAGPGPRPMSPTLEALSGAVAAQLDRSNAVKTRYDRRARARHARSVAARKDVAARDISRSSRRCGRRRRQLCRPDRGGAPGQSSQSRPGAGAQSGSGQSERRRPLRDRRDGRPDRVPADAGLAFCGNLSACCAGRDRCG